MDWKQTHDAKTFRRWEARLPYRDSMSVSVVLEARQGALYFWRYAVVKVGLFTCDLQISAPSDAEALARVPGVVSAAMELLLEAIERAS